MKKIRITESELIDLIEKLVIKEESNLDKLAGEKLTGQETPHDEDDMAPDGMDDDSDTMESITESQLINRLKSKLNEQEGKGCAESEGGSGCIKKRGDGWVILNNKKGGVWRKCDSEKHCEEILDAFHASKG